MWYYDLWRIDAYGRRLVEHGQSPTEYGAKQLAKNGAEFWKERSGAGDKIVAQVWEAP